MAVTDAGTVLTSLRKSLLNDSTGAIYTDAAMWPVMNKAYHELQTKLVALGAATVKEVTSAAIAVSAGTIRLGASAGLPTLLLYPIEVWERASGGTGADWELMMEGTWEPVVYPARERLEFWAWREDEIKFPAASTDREIYIKYAQSLGSITSSGSAITIMNCVEWLEQRTAVIAAVTIGNNPNRAKALSADLVTLWDDFKATIVKRGQSQPVRRRRTRYRRP